MKESGKTQDRLESIPHQEFTFGSIFMLANRLQALLDREFEPYGMTAKQWLLSIVIGGVFDEPPTLGEAASVMGSTHQNVKQVALKMQSKGFLEILPDPKDGRALRLKLTEKSHTFWMGLQKRSEEFMAEVYEGLSDGQMAELRASIIRMAENIGYMESKYKKGTDKG